MNGTQDLRIEGPTIMSLTASIGHSFVNVFEHTGHAPQPAQTAKDTSTATHASPGPRRNADVTANMARNRWTPDATNPARSITVNFSR
jgi:hypothetical protein